MSVRILQGDCREVMATLPGCSVDAIVTDPPYELGFMGKGWDKSGVANDVETWRQALRVLKPGGHLLAFSGTRTYHRMVCAIEDAGFEIRDQIGWVYGSGFPKSLDVSKAIDKAAGAEREKVRVAPRASTSGTMAGSTDSRPWIEKSREVGYHEVAGDVPVTDAARQWQGWGTALKPAWEPIVVARKPLIGTVAENVLAHGTGAINIDGCRVGADEGRPLIESMAEKSLHAFGNGLNGSKAAGSTTLGRWPANLIHDGSDEVLALFPREAGAASRVKGTEASAASVGNVTGERARVAGAFHADAGSAARFFYTAKASRADRNEGLQDPGPQFRMGRLPHDAEKVNKAGRGNHHPTVKPTDLMRYLCRLVTPPGGTVLDPFAGSGSTLKAAELEGFSAIGIELDPAYIEIARRRIAADAPLFAEVSA